MKLSRLLPVVLLLSACASTPLPDFRYYALPPPALVTAMESPALTLPLVFDDLRSAGVRGERPILYSSTLDRSKLLQYHYQLWSEPPTVLVQDSLLRTLEQSGIAPLVTDRLSLREPAVRLTGEITRFERTRKGEGWSASVEVRLRAMLANQTLPLLDQRYSAEVDASDDLLESSIMAFRIALDEISASLLADLTSAGPQVAAWVAKP